MRNLNSKTIVIALIRFAKRIRNFMTQTTTSTTTTTTSWSGHSVMMRAAGRNAAMAMAADAAGRMRRGWRSSVASWRLVGVTQPYGLASLQ